MSWHDTNPTRKYELSPQIWIVTPNLNLWRLNFFTNWTNSNHTIFCIWRVEWEDFKTSPNLIFKSSTKSRPLPRWDKMEGNRWRKDINHTSLIFTLFDFVIGEFFTQILWHSVRCPTWKFLTLLGSCKHQIDGLFELIEIFLIALHHAKEI